MTAALLKALLADANIRIAELLTDRGVLIQNLLASARLLEARFPELAKSQHSLIIAIIDRDERYMQRLEQQAAERSTPGALH